MSGARRWAVGAAVGATFAAAAALLLPLPRAAAANGEWEMLRWGIEAGTSVTGETWVLSGTISAPMSTDVITDIEFVLTRVEEVDGCPDLSRTLHVRDGDDAAFEDDPSITTTSTTAPTTTTTDPGQLDRYRFRYEVVPRCNGAYHLSVIGTADRLGLTPDDVSEPLHLGDPSNPEDAIQVGLRPPDVAATSATVGDGRAVTVSWQPPEAYAEDIGGPPPDLLGYAIDWSNDGGGSWHQFEAVPPTTYSHAEALPASAPAGDYQFRVRGVRSAVGHSNGAVAAGGATAIAGVTVGEAPAPPSTATPTTRRAGGGRGAPSQGPTTTFDEGFSETLDYSELLEEGDDEPELPDDASSFLDFIPERSGSAVLVPFAIAECLAVWALHLRYLARRVDDG